eukprot:GILJ01000859.1.p1 GENE.GILJ01000859.1~~GILJ01000859.1.p1  ORF type:complete len:299 (-),score=50.70 GILJ01000859.1:180-1076(-)
MLSRTHQLMRSTVAARAFASKVDPFGGRNLPVPPPNPERLRGKVGLVTGASSGIGRETALLFARSGIDGIVIADVSEQGGQETVDMINKECKNPKKAVFVKTDVSKSADCAKAVQTAESTFGKLNIMFNNAGIMHSDDDNAMTTEERIWDLTLNINLKGVFLCCKHGIPALQRAGGGSIINTASFVGLRGAATPQIAYTASKGGVLALSRELAMIHARQNIRVNSLCPGPLRTELLMKFLDTPEKMNRRLVHLPMGRFGEAREMAQAAAFLASDESSYITGADFLCDGGLAAAYVTPE